MEYSRIQKIIYWLKCKKHFPDIQQSFKYDDMMHMIDKEKSNIFSLGLICLSVKFEEIAKLKENAKL